MNRRAILTAPILTAAAATTAMVMPAMAASDDLDPARFLVERFAATLTAHDIVGFANLLADDYINHQASAAAPSAPPNAPGAKSAKQATVDFFNARLIGIPDLVVTIEASVLTADKLAASFVYEGTHGGAYFGIAATGKKLRFTSCDIFTVRAGKLAEHWGMGDIAGTLAQLKA